MDSVDRLLSRQRNPTHCLNQGSATCGPEVVCGFHRLFILSRHMIRKLANARTFIVMSSALLYFLKISTPEVINILLTWL